MAGSKGSKYFDIFLKYEIWLHSSNNKEVTNEEQIALLREIKRTNSLMAASKNLRISYRKAWGSIKKAEELLNFSLVEKQRGGKEGGNTHLTPEGTALIEAFDDLQQQIDKVLHDFTKNFFTKINKI